MSSPTVVSFDSIADIESMMTRLGKSKIRSLKVGRQSNLKVDIGSNRDAFFDITTRTIVGEIFQHKTSTVTPQSIIWIFENPLDGKFTLLGTVKGSGPNNSLRYLAWQSNETFTATTWIFGGKFDGPTGATSTVSSTTVTSQSIAQQNTTSATAQSTITTSRDGPRLRVTNNRNIQPQEDSESGDDSSENKTQTRSRKLSAPRGSQVIRTQSSMSTRSSARASATPAPTIPKSSSGIRKDKAKSKPTRKNSSTFESELIKQLEARLTKDAMSKLEKATPLQSSNNKRKRSQLEEMSDEEVSRQARHLIYGWFTAPEQAEREKSAKTLIGINIPTLIPVKESLGSSPEKKKVESVVVVEKEKEKEEGETGEEEDGEKEGEDDEDDEEEEEEEEEEGDEEHLGSQRFLRYRTGRDLRLVRYQDEAVEIFGREHLRGLAATLVVKRW